MFGMGFAEIFIIAIIAIIFLGPDKLPEAMVSFGKLIKKVKITLSDAKESIENEIHLDELKKETESYKKELEESKNHLLETTQQPQREIRDLFADLGDDDSSKKEK